MFSAYTQVFELYIGLDDSLLLLKLWLKFKPRPIQWGNSKWKKKIISAVDELIVFGSEGLSVFIILV